MIVLDSVVRNIYIAVVMTGTVSATNPRIIAKEADL